MTDFYFDLPKSTINNAFLKKSAFDQYLNTKQKTLLSNLVKRITWTNKLSPSTTNLQKSEIEEIAIFKVELKEITDDLENVIESIDLAIPYIIIFVIEHNDQIMLLTSHKYYNEANQKTYINHKFKSDWFSRNDKPYILNLKVSLDEVFKDFCLQIQGKSDQIPQKLNEYIQEQMEVDLLNKKIEKLKIRIQRTKQFKDKVKLNLELKELEKQLQDLK